MRRTKPGVDRAQGVAIRAQVGNAKRQVDKHTTHCYQCKQAGSDVYDHCKAWWDLMTELHRLRRKLRRFEMPQEPGQDVLPGMELPC